MAVPTVSEQADDEFKSALRSVGRIILGFAHATLPHVRPLHAHHRHELECHMTIDAYALKNLVERELQNLSDVRVLSHIRGFLVEPNAFLLHWDYGVPGQQFPCWVVLADPKSNGAIAYCEYGWRNPWGLIWLPTDERRHSSMGMGSGWFPTFLDAYFESSEAIDLPIWRVFKAKASGEREPLTDEGAWEDTWNKINELRKADPASRYDCGHSVN